MQDRWIFFHKQYLVKFDGKKKLGVLFQMREFIGDVRDQDQKISNKQ